MAFTRSEFNDFVADQSVDTKKSEEKDKLITTMTKVEKDLFLGSEDIQPVKWHQVGRLFRLAKGFIEMMVILWPYIKMIIKLFPKKK